MCKLIIKLGHLTYKIILFYLEFIIFEFKA